MQQYLNEALGLLSSPGSWILYFVCAILIGMSKTGIQNIGTITVPLFVLLFGAKYSTGIVLILLCIADLTAVIYYRKQLLWSEVSKLLPSALMGLFIGLIAGQYIDNQLFKILIGVCILFGIAIMFWSGRKNEQQLQKMSEKTWYSSLFGLIVGFSTMIGNAAGPALSVYLLTKKLPKYNFVATGAWFIMILNYTKIPLQIFVWDNLSSAGLILNLCAVPFILLGGFLGIKMVEKLKEAQFKTLITALVILSSVLLIFI